MSGPLSLLILDLSICVNFVIQMFFFVIPLLNICVNPKFWFATFVGGDLWVGDELS